ncbi:hypothetical protein OBBRIDRAFT_707920, partial [Obba rivulosa]
FTQRSNPWKPECIEAVLRAVTIGDNLNEDQWMQVHNLIAEFADCFALSVSEVLPVKDAVHTLNIPEGATFTKKVHQRPLTPPQKAYLHKKIDELLATNIVEHCDPSLVKCVSPITLAQKAH